MLSRRIDCAICGAGLTQGDILYDEHTENYFCDNGCFRDWADHTQKPIEYYERHNLVEVDLSEEGYDES